MKALTAFVAALLSAMVVGTAPASAAPPFVWTARALFERINPFYGDGCVVLKLDLRIDTTTASVDYWAEDVCFGLDYGHLTGTTTLQPGQVQLSSLGSASLTNVLVDVAGQGYIQQFTFNLTWTGSGTATVSRPRDGTGVIARSVDANVSGTVVDLGGTTLFTGQDVSEAQITQVLHTFD